MPVFPKNHRIVILEYAIPAVQALASETANRTIINQYRYYDYQYPL
jgi:hypothetical protein